MGYVNYWNSNHKNNNNGKKVFQLSMDSWTYKIRLEL